MRTNFQFSCDPPLARLRITGELDPGATDRQLDVLQCLTDAGGTLEVVAASVCYRLISRLAGCDNLQAPEEQPPRLTVLHTVSYLHVGQRAGHG